MAGTVQDTSTTSPNGGNAAVRDALENAPTTHARLLAWVREVADLTEPDAVVWVDGSEAEWTRLTDGMVESGTFVRLAEDKFPNSFAAFSDPEDVARVEEQTFICSKEERGSGPTNNWMDPEEMKATLRGLYRGSMHGRTMYVIPFVMGSLDATDPKFGVELTDSPYVVCSMRIMATIGSAVLEKMTATDAFFVEALHSVGFPLDDGQTDVPWPCNETKYIVQFPEDRAIWSYGSGYGGNALLGKKCYALRIASAIAHDEGWLAEHMLVLKITDPQQRAHYVAGAFPSACGKTNFAMIEPTVEGWKAEMVGDDIAWMRFDDAGTLRVVNPEAGLFGVAPGTGWSTNPNAMRAVAKGNTIFTNVALTDDGGVWWEGMTDEVPAHLTDWRGRSWTPGSKNPAAHPNSRFCTPIKQVDILAPEYDDPDGVPLSAIIFGGRRKTTVPLVHESFDWEHGVFEGATLSSETTAAASGAVGVVRRDPMAMLPFIGYNAGDYLAHWVKLGKAHPGKMPKIFYVNWFRRDRDGKFAWPGFGENSRVLKWIVGRLEGEASGEQTPIGIVPRPEDLDLTGLDISEQQLGDALKVDVDEWVRELPGIHQWFNVLHDTLPPEMIRQYHRLEVRLEV
ncbi:phosphoenolpyruvate carboxykinase (GTP) [Tersicoccus sp. Bi-70]|uniref:phosphoenolpyruvate carboxykinase (GTP) n=1 Tax=Tersicoccus sp. Bi-70 TaxID=1897634 RepID=UPI000975D359|nr:phosphoenolpyruvate carboxykinase (GTP) [Tersicoccus sp. Bi-70]OMH30617.1 phosphoenolpyruvate carboxykinase [Tersicoccus sp. Bi-70]